MNVLDSFCCFFKKVGYVVQLLQNEGPHMIAMFIAFVHLRNDYKGQMWNG
jgi:hypothetical protein